MNAIQVYIWGVRYGFTEGTALFPERNRLTDASEIQDYDNICHYFTSAKDVAFRSGQRDFYFLMQDHQYQIYSLVDKSHQDIAGREAYLVYSIVCPKSKIIGGSIKDGLQNLKKLYKTRNADYTIRTNMFTNDQVRSVISNLTLSSGNTRSIGNNTVCYFQDESELNLNEYSGNEVYFMQTGSNPEIPNHLNLSVHQLNLGQINKQIQQKSQSVGEFRALLNAKSNFEKANEIYTSISSQLNINERSLFENWKSEMHYASAVTQLRNLISSFIQNNSTDYTPCEKLLAQFPTITNHLTGDEQKALHNWQNLKDKQILTNEKNEIDELVNEINKAEKHNYGIPINAFETRLQKNQLQHRLPSDSQIKLKSWRNTQKHSEIENEIAEIYKEVTTRDRSTILVKQNEWLKTIEGWAKRLDRESPFDEETQKKYKFLLSKKWVKNHKPIAKIAVMAFVAIALTGGGFFTAMNWDVWFPKVVDVPQDPQPPTPQPRPEGGDVVENSDNNDLYTDFIYKDKTYRVEKSLLTEAGSKYNTNKRFYRFLNGKWEMKEAPAAAKWKPATPSSDILLILTKWDEKFKTEQTISKGDSNTNNSGNANNNNGGNTNNNNGANTNTNNGGNANNNNVGSNSNGGKANNDKVGGDSNGGKANNNNGGGKSETEGEEVEDATYVILKKNVKAGQCDLKCIESSSLTSEQKKILKTLLPKN